jgi:hypothetical protein
VGVLKRAAALVRLSRDHHESLVAAQRVGGAAPARAGRGCEGFLAFWNRDGARHFRIEEEVLLPALAVWGDAYEPLVARTLCDHVAIRARIRELRENRDAAIADLHALGEALAAHVRMEERELFPLIERTIPAAELDMLADAVERAERS